MRVLSLSLALCVAVTSAHPDYSDTWEEFKGKYGKEYTDTDEEVEILEELGGDINIACAGLQAECVDRECEVHLFPQCRVEDGLHDFSVGENEFADMTQQEITSYFNGLAMEETSPSGQTFSSDVSLESLPAEVDWRKNVSSYCKYYPWLSPTCRAQSHL